ncbi:hypothetical protein PSTG_12407 [Puccinia striiformis f. sp. tritici PST-78]|uniref:Uncharacterized protein n=1 Tax=Puccinia striiformis f. sp. tritici PST-78 TaxID=1165861 RepID=A0A0L0V4P3_9BASI|nr:hypothetical protein PSTG_12407 [Puccinia striiformis f. sp. tritici PST-78]
MEGKLPAVAVPTSFRTNTQGNRPDSAPAVNTKGEINLATHPPSQIPFPPALRAPSRGGFFPGVELLKSADGAAFLTNTEDGELH